MLALIVRKPNAELDADQVIAFSQARLARYKCPRRVEFVSQFPMTSAGKIDKVALRRAYAASSRAGS